MKPCPCGEQHDPAVEMAAAYFENTFGETVVVTTPAGSWHVPRRWIAIHGLKGADVPALAAKYGWTAA